MLKKTPPRTSFAVRIASATFIVVYVLAALFAHYIGWRSHTDGPWPMTIYEPLSWLHASEFAVVLALITGIWMAVKCR